MAVENLVTDYGVTTANTGAQNAAALTTMFNTYTGQTVIDCPPGTYDVEGTVGISVSADTRAQLHLRGAGRRSTIFRQTDGNDSPVFEFKTTTGNLRDLKLSDITFNTGGLVLDKCVYCLFDNINFEHIDSDALSLGSGTAFCTFTKAWWVHCEQIIVGGGGSAEFNGCLVGEDCGGISSSCSTTWNGGQIYQGGRKSGTPVITGYDAFLDAHSGTIHVFNGTKIRLVDDKPFANLQLCRRVVLNSVDLKVASTGNELPIFVVRNKTQTEASRARLLLQNSYLEGSDNVILHKSVLRLPVDDWVIDAVLENVASTITQRVNQAADSLNRQN
jgi:hypothetical protein